MSKLSQMATGLGLSGLVWAALAVQAQTPSPQATGPQQPPPQHAPPQTPAPAPATSMAQRVGLFVFPQGGQTADTQLNDEAICYGAAKTASGVDPNNLQPTNVQAQTQEGGGVRGGARGAAVGAIGGAIGGNAGKGAAIGAAVGAIGGRRRQNQANEQAQQQAAAQSQAGQQQQIDTFKRVMTACLQSKNYSVK